ncbi:sigma-70 family RNA polymerase sigma factor [Laspinema sp. D1]|uniref:RNA polymerase sigma factor n=1 Tax=Laspinema palackyanum D2a TaxID=2953684 RepID=A0ABT2N148_9CYAN|nr:sigma-70 family RNA polymerase sigma factor [Laspinema sp. D2a]
MVKCCQNRDFPAGDRLLCQDCFGQLYRRYQHQVRSTLYQLCGAPEIDDLVQEVFLKVWKGLPKLRQPAYFSTWLYRITWNVATDRRQGFVKEQAQHRGSIALLQEDSSSDRPPQSQTPDLMHLHYQDLVQRGLEGLSFEHRAVLVLHDLEDLPQKEVAQIMNIPVGTVKSRLFHARASMRKFLESEGVQL